MANNVSTKIGHLPGGGFMKIGTDENGLDAILTSGVADSDVAIVAAIGADALYADGSLYIEVKDGAGKVWQKQADTWVDLQV